MKSPMVLAVVLVGGATLGLAGCGSSSDASSTGNEAQSSPATPADSTPTASATSTVADPSAACPSADVVSSVAGHPMQLQPAESYPGVRTFVTCNYKSTDGIEFQVLFDAIVDTAGVYTGAKSGNTYTQAVPALGPTGYKYQDSGTCHFMWQPGTSANAASMYVSDPAGGDPCHFLDSLVDQVKPVVDAAVS